MSSMFTLTEMTGKEASEQRTVVIGTVELNWRVWMIVIFASPLALMATAIAWLFIGQIAIIMIPIVEAAAIFLFHRRTTSGLRLRTYQAFWDKKKANVGEFVLCGQPLSIGEVDYRTLVPNCVPYQEAPQAPSGSAAETLSKDAMTPRPSAEGARRSRREKPAAQASMTPVAAAPDPAVIDPAPAPELAHPPAATPAPVTVPTSPAVPVAPEARHAAPLDPARIGVEQDTATDVAAFFDPRPPHPHDGRPGRRRKEVS